jgi:Bardet-Biedl syndrome 9 protein
VFPPQADWTLVLGEQALDLSVPSFSPSSSSIFVCGERNLYFLKDNRHILFMKKLEYNTSCFLPYSSGNGRALVLPPLSLR